MILAADKSYSLSIDGFYYYIIICKIPVERCLLYMVQRHVYELSQKQL